MGGFKEYSDNELSFLMRSDNKEIRKRAFDEVYERYSSVIYTFCLRFVKNETIAKDAFQDTFIKFFDSVQTKVEGIDNIGGFLLKIARNECLNARKTQSKKNIDIDEIEIKFNDNSYERKQNKEVLLDALNRLPAKYRELLILKEFLNYSYNEIAEITEQSRNNVGIMLHRAKQMLKEIVLKIHKINKIEIED